MLGNYKEVIVEIQNDNGETLGTAFYIGNNCFISAYHCVHRADSNLVLFFAESKEGIYADIIQWNEKNDIVLLCAQKNNVVDRYPFPFASVEALYPRCEFWLSGFGNRLNYKEHVPAPAHGVILDAIDNDNELDLEGSGLYPGMSGAPLIVGDGDNPMVAGILKSIFEEENVLINQANGVKRGKAISTKVVFDFLNKCNVDKETILFFQDSRKELLNTLFDCLKNKKKCIISGIKGIGKYHLLKRAIKLAKKRNIIELSGKNEELGFAAFIKNPKIINTFDIIWEMEERNDLLDYINNVISSDLILGESVIVIKYYKDVSLDLMNFLSAINVSIIILTDSILESDFKWIRLFVTELNRYECAELIRNFSVGKRINNLPYDQFKKLVNNIYFTCGGIPLLINWVCSEINLGKGTEKTILSKISKKSNESMYFQYLDGIIGEYNDDSLILILCAVAIGIDGISKEILQFITELCEDKIDDSLEYLVSRGFVFDNGKINDDEVLYSTYQVIFNFLVEKEKGLIFHYIKRYIDYYSDYAKEEDFNAIPIDVLWEYFSWSENYQQKLFIEWMYAFSYYFFETGRLSERKDIGIRAEKICSKVGDEKNRLWCIVNEIAYIDYVQGNYYHAEKIIRDNLGAAQKFAEKEYCKDDRFNGRFILSLYYRYLGLILGKRHKFGEAHVFLEQSKRILIELGRKSIENNVKLEVGELLLSEKKYEESYKYLDDCKIYYENRYKTKPWMSSWLARTHLDIAKYFFRISNYTKMTSHIEECSNLLEIKDSALISMELDLFLQEIAQDIMQQKYFLNKAKKTAFTMGVSIDKMYNQSYRANNDRLVFILAKYPYSGRAKTRLIHDIGFEKASSIAAALIEDVVEELETGTYDLLVCPPVEDIKYADDFQKILPNIQFCYVFEGGLRGKNSNMYERIEQFFITYKKVVLIYSDTPFVEKSIVEECFKLLDSQDVVIGNDGEGGYYMVGMKRPYDIFTSLSNLRIPYLTATLEILDRSHAQYSVVHPLKDLDTVQDIKSILWKDNLGLWKRTYNLLNSYGLL